MLTSRTYFILVLFSIVFQLTYGRSQKHEKDFNVLVFCQEWPESFCFKLKSRNAARTCRLPIRQGWMIHGIWPSQFHTIGPSFCDRSLYFNESELAPIRDQLEEKWMTIEKEKPLWTFWRYQWEKHGTCATGLTDLNTQLKYFQKALDLLSQYDMSRVLAKANIYPGRNYAVQEIINGVEKILGKTVYIGCVRNTKMHESYIREIKICLDKSLQLTNCNGIVDFPTNCDRSMPVSYPNTTPSPNGAHRLLNTNRAITYSKHNLPRLVCMILSTCLIEIGLW